MRGRIIIIIISKSVCMCVWGGGGGGGRGGYTLSLTSILTKKPAQTALNRTTVIFSCQSSIINKVICVRGSTRHNYTTTLIKLCIRETVRLCTLHSTINGPLGIEHYYYTMPYISVNYSWYETIEVKNIGIAFS